MKGSVSVSKETPRTILSPLYVSMLLVHWELDGDPLILYTQDSVLEKRIFPVTFVLETNCLLVGDGICELIGKES